MKKGRKFQGKKKNPSKNTDLKEHGIREVTNLKEEYKQSAETRLERQEDKGHKRACMPVHGVWTSFEEQDQGSVTFSL